jgi:integrase
MPSHGDTRHLELHGRQWRVVVYVPRHLRSMLGKAAIRRGLGTDSLKVAQARRWAVLAELRKIITEAEAKVAGGTSNDPVAKLAIEWREVVSALDDVARATDLSSDLEHAHLARTVIVESVRSDIELEHGAAKARDFAAIVDGKRTPLALHHEAFLREHRHFAKRTVGDHRRALRGLADFATGSGFSCTVEAFSERRTAGFFASHLAGLGWHPRTANKLISMLAGYWRWMMRRGHAPGSDPKRDNPWLGQSLPNRQPYRSHEEGPAAPLSDSKRPFTDEEVVKLIHSDTPETEGSPLLRTFMLTAALSGMRIDEIARLQLRDVDLAQRTMAIRRGKSEAGRRTVPIHSELLPVITGQHEKARELGSAWLFPELPNPHRDSLTERSMAMGKRFGRHRKRLGIHEQAEGQRQSNIDFHSFRRWFITKAEQAGIPPHIISTVVGHAEGRKGMTLSTYSGGPALDQLRSCVEAVRLPAPCQPDGLNNRVLAE